MLTTSQSVITSSVWEDVRTQFNNDITSAVSKYNIPDELILKLD